MAVQEYIVNDAETILSVASGSADSSIAVANAAKFPIEGVFRVRIDNEIMLVTSVSGTTFNVTRGVDGTAAADHVNGSQVAAIVTRDGINRVITERVFPLSPTRQPFRLADGTDTLLTSSDFTEDDPSNTMAVTDHFGGAITLKHDPFDTSEKISGILRSAPTAPYTVTGAYRLTTCTAGTTEGGIFGPYMNRSANDNRLVWRHRPFDDSFGFTHNVNHYALSTFQSNVGTFRRLNRNPGGIMWFKLEDNNTNIKMFSSYDGVHYTLMYDQSRTAHLGGAPDEIGICIDNLTAYDAYLTLLAWKES